ncbi:hypothetical protein F8M41_016766 [Gigaspora margarita]|uniref:Uncharacterized protein n=1 Tax=Gigaspora margarita TaxID=4874 RepID=A0A8H4B325_GIGMA|nr:hypothetical protein F8M41_016766 [Gigaspora margarita]
MDIQYAGRNDHKGPKHGSKDEVKRKVDNNNIAIENWCGRYISDIKVDIDSVKVVQKFYIKCRFRWKDENYYCTIQSSVDETTFMISENSMFDENVLERDCVMKLMSIQTKGVNSKYVFVKSGSKDNIFEFDNNGNEAADVKANKSKIGYQYEDGIDIEKDEEKIYSSYQKSSAIATVGGNCNYE